MTIDPQSIRIGYFGISVLQSLDVHTQAELLHDIVHGIELPVRLSPGNVDELAAHGAARMAALADEGIDPDDALAVVEHGLETLMLPGVEIELAGSGAGRRVRVDRNAVQALITSFVHLAIEQVRPSGRVRVGVEHRDGRGAFVIEDDGPADPGLADWRDEPLRGRTLLCAVASHVADALGGEVHARTAATGSRVELWLPYAEAG